MNGKTHVMLSAASMSGAALSGVGLVDCAAMAVLAAGFSLGPDIDHPSSTLSRVFPSLHPPIHRMSCLVREATSTGKDKADSAWRKRKGHDPDHRALTHTALSAAAVGVLAMVTSILPGGTIAMGMLSAWAFQKFLPFPKWVVVGTCGALMWLANLSPELIWWAVSMGWFSHVLADACTMAGTPVLWPLPIKGKRWWRVKILGNRLMSGGRGEGWVALVASVVISIPFWIL